MRELSQKEKIGIAAVSIGALVLGGGAIVYCVWPKEDSSVLVAGNTSTPGNFANNNETHSDGSSEHAESKKKRSKDEPTSPLQKTIKSDPEACKKFHESITQLETDPTSPDAPKYATDAKKSFQEARAARRKGSPYYHESLEAPDLETHFNHIIEARLSEPDPGEVALKKVKMFRHINPQAPNAFGDKNDLNEILETFTKRKSETSKEPRGKSNSDDQNTKNKGQGEDKPKDGEQSKEQTVEGIKAAAKQLLTKDIDEVSGSPMPVNQVLALDDKERSELCTRLNNDFSSGRSRPQWKTFILLSNIQLMTLASIVNTHRENKIVQAWAKNDFKIHKTAEFNDFIRCKLPLVEFTQIATSLSNFRGQLIWFKVREKSTSWEGHLESALANFFFRFVSILKMPEAYMDSVIKFCSVTKETDVQSVVDDLKSKSELARIVKEAFTNFQDTHVDLNRLYNMIVTQI